MTDVATKDVTATVDAYFAMWNEEDDSNRFQRAKQAWAENGRYIDPAREGEGHQGLSEMMATARAQFPGYSLRRASGIDVHHDKVRFAWEAVAPDGSVPIKGVDFGELAADGRLQRITGFNGDLPE